MNQTLQAKCDQLVSNDRIIKKAGFLESTSLVKLGSLLYMFEGKTPDLERIKACRKILKGKVNPNRLTVFALAIALKLDLDQTQDLLMKAGYAINRSSVQDMVLASLITKGIYDRNIIDDLLYDLDLMPLPGSAN